MPSEMLRKRQDAQVLAGLGHEALVRGRRPAAPGRCRPATGQHVFDKFFVAGHVDDAGLFSVGQVEVGEAQFDGDAALLSSLMRSVSMPGQRLNQGSFAVVDVAGGADDDIFHAVTPLFWVDGSSVWVKITARSSPGCSARCRQSGVPRMVRTSSSSGPWRCGR